MHRATDKHLYGAIEDKNDLHRSFSEIRHDITQAKYRSDLVELYTRARHLITLTYEPAWNNKFGADAAPLRKLAVSEFTKITHHLNHRARKIGMEPNYEMNISVNQ